MVHRAQLRNSFSVVLLLLFAHCRNGGGHLTVYPKLNSTDSNFKQVNGIVFYKNNLFTGSVFALYDNTTDTAALLSYKEGKENGVWKKFYSNGQPMETRAFADGKKSGEMTAWYDNGKIKWHYTFSNNEYEGLCREWNRDGMLIKEMHYHNGYEDGMQKYFYDNGKIRSNYQVINGRRFGLLGTKNCVNVKDSIFKN